MGIEENKALVQRHFEELLNGWSLDLVDEIFSPDYVHHHPDRDNLKPGIDGVKQFLAQAAAAFPDSRIVIEDICAEGDKVWVRTSSESTHLGDYLGLPATGKKIRKRSMDIFRIRDGKFIEHWDIMDDLGIWLQLGLAEPRA